MACVEQANQTRCGAKDTSSGGRRSSASETNPGPSRACRQHKHQEARWLAFDQLQTPCTLPCMLAVLAGKPSSLVQAPKVSPLPLCGFEQCCGCRCLKVSTCQEA